MEFIEGLVLGFFGGVVPLLLILIMTNDEKASRAQKNTARTERGYYDCLSNIKNILQKISVQKTSLIFSYYPMDKQVEESLSRIRQMDTTDENPHYHIVQTDTCILLNWGKSERVRRI